MRPCQKRFREFTLLSWVSERSLDGHAGMVVSLASECREFYCRPLAGTGWRLPPPRRKAV